MTAAEPTIVPAPGTPANAPIVCVNLDTRIGYPSHCHRRGDDGVWRCLNCGRADR